MSESQGKALKTIGGAMYYTLCRYGHTMDMHTEMLNSYLKIPLGCPYYIEKVSMGFIYTTRTLIMKYQDDEDWHEKREVTVTRTQPLDQH